MKTRQVKNPIGSITEQLGDFLAKPIDILQKRDDDKTTLIKSTEEHLASSTKFNKEKSA